jgi:hypothetical protein
MRTRIRRATHGSLHGHFPFHDIALIGDYFDIGERGREEFVQFLRCQLDQTISCGVAEQEGKS